MKMRVLIFSVLLTFLFVNASAFANIPERDLATAQLRQEFAQARQPTVSDLKLGKTWTCKSYVAMHSGSPSDNQVFPSIMGSFSYANGSVYLNDDEPTPLVPAHGSLQFAANATPAGMTVFVRVTAQGDLITEQAASSDVISRGLGEPYASIAVTDTSIADPNQRLIAYSTCSN